MPADPVQLDRAARELGRKVYRLRRQQKLTQEELAHLSGVSRNQIQNIEHSRNNTRDPLTRQLGRGNPRLDTLYHLAEAFGVSPAVLIDPDADLPEP
ncbi:helix-turn-helix domain-containing protein [Propionicimonas sp.]|uniref:helix-turn-helix domain-containing protein n=1 Tax=Propionicimonas sp. TaxID=1955623 RepID=UPI0039E641D0